MEKSDLKQILDKLEAEKRVRLPQRLLESDNLKKFDKFLTNRYSLGLYHFYNKMLDKDVGIYEDLSEELKNRGKVAIEDKKLIKGIYELLKKSKTDYIFEGVGNFSQIEELVNELRKTKLSLKIKIPLFFWIYLNIVETLSSYLAETYLFIAYFKEDADYIKEFQEKKNKGEHLLFSDLRRFSLNWGLINKDEKNFLSKNNLRNKIAHANLYYDSKRKKIIVADFQDLKIADFRKEFIYLYNLLKELIFTLNGDDSDLSKNIKKIREKNARFFHKMVRQNSLNKIFQELDISDLKI